MALSRTSTHVWFGSGQEGDGTLTAGYPNSVVIKVGMLGDSQIGKTSLMVKYVEGHFDEDYIQTLGSSRSTFADSNIHSSGFSPLFPRLIYLSFSILRPSSVPSASKSLTTRNATVISVVVHVTSDLELRRPLSSCCFLSPRRTHLSPDV